MSLCQSCMREVDGDFCPKCRKELFDGINVPGTLVFESPHTAESDEYREHSKRISISGVQAKYSLKKEDDRLALTDMNGQFILKPIPFGGFTDLDQAPANEHLTMQIAKQIHKLNTPPNAIMYFSDGSMAYLVRRFDVDANGSKFQQEDFAQLANASVKTMGDSYKYDLSYEDIALLMKQYIPTFKLEVEKLYEMIIFNYLYCNGDAHLKNFSLINHPQKGYVLTPVYDLICTKIHSKTESDLALTLFAEGYPKSFEELGYHTSSDFIEFGIRIGVVEKRAKKLLSGMVEESMFCEDLVERSFLSQETKKMYLAFHKDRRERLSR
jgi:serine/threonine-protein kinase HipA